MPADARRTCRRCFFPLLSQTRLCSCIPVLVCFTRYCARGFHGATRCFDTTRECFRLCKPQHFLLSGQAPGGLRPCQRLARGPSEYAAWFEMFNAASSSTIGRMSQWDESLEQQRAGQRCNGPAHGMPGQRKAAPKRRTHNMMDAQKA
ncbi:MAG: hypothetical protein J3K34DRAFT_141901, partial [Monoraphidium minutum]